MKRRFGKSKRVRSSGDFQTVYDTNIHAADDILVVNGARNGRPETRLGLSIGRQIGSAVVRNRWKRLIREAFRAAGERLPSGLDLVVRPKRGSAPDYVKIAKSLERLAQQIDRKLMRRGEKNADADSIPTEKLPPRRVQRSEPRK